MRQHRVAAKALGPSAFDEEFARLEDAFGEMTPMTEATTMREVVGARRLRVRAPAPGSFEV